jgi:hypothetical protein
MKKIIILTALLLSASFLSAQEFGFGNDSDDDGGTNSSGFGSFGASALTVTISGEVSAELLGYTDDFSNGATHTSLGDVFSGKLNFSAGTQYAEGVINLKLQTTSQPVTIDEAYARAYFGGLEIEGGLRKLTWGKADSFGPLDIINPLDYSELTNLGDIMNLKIARPLIHASYRAGSFTKIEVLFVPSFEPLRFAEEGRWVPAQMAQLNELSSLNEEDIKKNLPPGLASMLPPGMLDDFKVDINQPDVSTIKYAQAGARFTTTIGPADLGLQYYYGRITRPAATFSFTIMPPSAAINFDYNPYHQIGVDWAQVLFGFNVRAEVAANITYDLKGDDPAVYNPALLWSFGFDRDLIAGINLNFQCNESIRLMDDKIKNDRPLKMFGIDQALDIEADTDMTSTRIITAISRKFFRDELETRFAAMWGIEDSDFLLIPSIIWTRDTISLELSAGIFGGSKEGELGQYKDNTFIKTVLTYSF